MRAPSDQQVSMRQVQADTVTCLQRLQKVSDGTQNGVCCVVVANLVL